MGGGAGGESEGKREGESRVFRSCDIKQTVNRVKKTKRIIRRWLIDLETIHRLDVKWSHCLHTDFWFWESGITFD